MTRQARTGFTIVELLVVITVIGVLIALLLSAVQAAREAARRMQCSGNLRQIGVAMQNYHSTYNSLPVGAYDCCWGTWMVAILPGLEHKTSFDLYKHIGKFDQPPGYRYWGGGNQPVTTKRFAVFTCPSDGEVSHPERHNVTAHNYVVNMGNTGFSPNTNFRTQPVQNMSGVRFGGAPFLIGGSPSTPAPVFNISQIRGGLSNTLMVSETIQGRADDLRGVVWWGWGCHFETHLQPNSREPDVMQYSRYCNMAANPRHPCTGYAPTSPITAAARSWHPGGVQAAMCDGSVRFIANGIDLATWRTLGTVAGHDVVQDFRF